MQPSTEAYAAIRQRFVNWVMNWGRKESTDGSQKAMEVNMVDMVKMLSAIGFKIRYTDLNAPEDIASLSNRTEGCRVVITCTHSGLRMVMEASGATCKCPDISAHDNLQGNPPIEPFSEATARIIREITEHLAHIDCESISTSQQMKNMNKFRSMDNLLSGAACHTPAQRKRVLSNDDISSMELNQLDIPMKSHNGSLNSIPESIAESSSLASSTETLPNEQNTTVEQVLENGMDHIRNVLQFFRKEDSISDLIKNANIEQILENTMDCMRQALQIYKSENSSKLKSGLQSLASASSADTLPNEKNSIEQSLKNAMDCIGQALLFYRKEYTSTCGKDAMFKVPKVTNKAEKTKCAAMQNSCGPKITIRKAPSTADNNNTPLKRPATPHPVKKGASGSRTVSPKSNKAAGLRSASKSGNVGTPVPQTGSKKLKKPLGSSNRLFFE